MDQFGIPEHRIVSHDGTSIAYWISRPPPALDRGLTLMLANGIGISRFVWRDLVAAFRPYYTLVFWDYRCFYRSSRPVDLQRLTLADHAQDVAHILAVEHLHNVVLVGWSMGVQVSLETWRFASERLAGMVLMNGTPGRTYETAFGLPGLAWWVPPVTTYLSSRHPTTLRKVIPPIFRRELVPVLRQSGTVAPCVDAPMLGRILEEYASLDFGIYFHLLNALNAHQPMHLEEISCPALVLVGGRDLFTPPLAGKRLRARLAQGELERVELGTHYMLMEYHLELQQKIERFLEQRVHPIRAPRETQNAEARVAEAIRAATQASAPGAVPGELPPIGPDPSRPGLVEGSGSGHDARPPLSDRRISERLRRRMRRIERPQLRQTLRHVLKRLPVSAED